MVRDRGQGCEAGEQEQHLGEQFDGDIDHHAGAGLGGGDAVAGKAAGADHFAPIWATGSNELMPSRISRSR